MRPLNPDKDRYFPADESLRVLLHSPQSSEYFCDTRGGMGLAPEISCGSASHDERLLESWAHALSTTLREYRTVLAILRRVHGLGRAECHAALLKQVRPASFKVAALEKAAILNALQYSEGCAVNAAALCGIGKTTLYRKLQQYGIRKTEPAVCPCCGCRLHAEYAVLEHATLDLGAGSSRPLTTEASNRHPGARSRRSNRTVPLKFYRTLPMS